MEHEAVWNNCAKKVGTKLGEKVGEHQAQIMFPKFHGTYLKVKALVESGKSDEDIICESLE